MSGKKLTVACPGSGRVFEAAILGSLGQSGSLRLHACHVCGSRVTLGKQYILQGDKGTCRTGEPDPGTPFHLVLPTHDIEVTLGEASTKADEDDLHEVRMFLYDQGWLGEGRPHEELRRRLKDHQAMVQHLDRARTDLADQVEALKKECAEWREEAKTRRFALKNLAFLAMRVVTGDSVAPLSRLNEDAQIVWGILQHFRNDLDHERATAKHREEELNRARTEAQTLRRERDGEVWIWQGDGGDDPESLTCPVLVEAEQVRAWVKAEKDLVRERGERGGAGEQASEEDITQRRVAIHAALRARGDALRAVGEEIGRLVTSMEVLVAKTRKES